MRILGCSKALNRDHLGAVQFSHFGQARAYGLAVHNNCAGTALSFAVARLLGPGQLEIFPEKIQENPFGIYDKLLRARVDCQPYFLHYSSFFNS
jgi:hypothetical protein